MVFIPSFDCPVGEPRGASLIAMCTRVLWNTNDLAVLTGRTMDWPESTHPLIVGFPRGRERSGIDPAGLVDDPNPLRWTSRHSSLVTTVYGMGSVDGLNEAGLGGHALYLEATHFGSRDAAKPAVQAGLWLQYLLDQAATVAEAVALMENVQVITVNAHGHDANLHLAIEDAGGDSAIIELADGGPVVHHGRQYTLMTNDPTYDEQLTLLAAQDYSHPSSDMLLPGNVNAVDRFQRAAYYSALLPQPSTEREAIAGVTSLKSGDIVFSDVTTAGIAATTEAASPISPPRSRSSGKPVSSKLPTIASAPAAGTTLRLTPRAAKARLRSASGSASRQRPDATSRRTRLRSSADSVISLSMCCSVATFIMVDSRPGVVSSGHVPGAYAAPDAAK